jgi:hypothetical protein
VDVGRAACAAVAALLALPLGAAAQAPPRDTTAAPAAAPASEDSVYRPEELREYLLGMVGPRPVIRIVALAGFDQWRRRPVAFPPGWRGFTDRLGSRAGQVAISHTLRFAIARAFDERTIRYRPCACGDTVSRVLYALVSPLRVDTPAGRHLSAMYAVTEIASGILVTTVRSNGLQVGDGIRNGLTGIAAESATSLVRELWPWRWRPPFL